MSRLTTHLLLVLTGLCLAGPQAFAAGPPAVVDARTLVPGQTRFALDLYARLRGEKGNLFFSPYSLSTGMATASAGAAGDTLKQMEKVLHFPPQDALHPAAAALARGLEGGKNPRCQVRMANALWGQAGFPFRPEFVARLNKHHAAGFHQVDFQQQREQALKTINAWVQKQTRDQIKDLLKPQMLDVQTRMVLTSAVSFKGDWNSQFKKSATRTGPFTRGDGTKVQAPLMSQKGTFAYRWVKDAKLQVLEMPYVGKDLSLVALLPEAADGLPALEKQLTPDNLTKWLKSLRMQPVAVVFPRLRMTWEKELPEILAEMGMPLAFSTKADFSRAESSSEGLLLSRVVHKAFVEVNEEGTTASAATGITGTARGIDPSFKADQPFVFFIRDRRTDSILFLGRVENPTAG